jgi:hypothetical protein
MSFFKFYSWIIDYSIETVGQSTIFCENPPSPEVSENKILCITPCLSGIDITESWFGIVIDTTESPVDAVESFQPSKGSHF